jgi:hypothetical protein
VPRQVAPARYQSLMILGPVGRFMVVAADEANQSSGRFKHLDCFVRRCSQRRSSD